MRKSQKSKVKSQNHGFTLMNPTSEGKSSGFTLMNKASERSERGFTLIELLVVISILGVLATIGLNAFQSSQARGRDAQRKSDLKQIATALDLYYSDAGVYPDASNGVILGCPSTSSSPCTWGTGKQFTDGKTIYMKNVPKDPSASRTYFYRTVAVDSVANSGFQIFAHLENTQDSSIITTVYSCGTGGNCDFAVTSSNTTPSE